jgi:hypothetical protein
MRRSMLVGIAVAVLLLAVLGIYTAYWYIAAGRLENGIGQWAQSLRPHQIDLSWHTIHVAGYPFAFRLEASDIELHDHSKVFPSDLRVPSLSASPKSWDFRVWHLAAPGGVTAVAGPAGRPSGRLGARSADGTILVLPSGEAVLWLDLAQPSADFGMRLVARRAAVTLTLPAHPPQTDREPALGLAVEAHDLSLPRVPPPFRNPLDQLSVGMTVLGKVPSIRPKEAAEAWRDAGGTVEFGRIALRWGGLQVTGSGTAALDQDLQPIASFSGGIEGWGRVIAALVAAGRIREGEAGLAGLALGFLAKKGPDGNPQISTSLTMQNGQMHLGPLHIGPAPHIDWH